MLHPDERRDPDEQRRQRMALAMTEPDVLFEKYEGLLGRDQRSKKRERALNLRIAALELEVKRARQQQDAELKRRLGSAMGALDAYRAESRRLKADLQRVRASRSMRIGRAALAPVRLIKRMVGPEAPGQDAVTPHQEQAASPPASAREVELPPAVATHGPASAETSLADLISEFERDPSANNLARVVNRMWFRHGEITRPARFLTQHASLVAESSTKDQILAQRILGEQRVLDSGVLVPPRAKGLDYVAERGRVMYCVHSTPVFNSNGYSTRTRGVAAGLLAAGADPVVVGRPGYPWDSAIDRAAPKELRQETALDGVRYVHLPGADLTTTPIDRYIDIAADAFVREARRQRPSVIQSASNHRTALPALIAARRLGVPFVYEVRGLWEITTASAKTGWGGSDQFRSLADLETLVAREADSVLAITPQLADELERRGIDRERITIAPNAVDSDEFAPIPRDDAYAAQQGIPGNVPVIGFAGSIVGYEGLETLLDASAELERRGVAHKIVIAGSGAAVAQLKSQRESLGLKTVKFLGRLPIEDMPRLLSTFDIMPLPRMSTPVTEMVSPLKPLEAFSAMKPVVASDVEPHKDLVGDDGERGRLFAAGDAMALADTLEALIADRDAAAALGRRARMWVLDYRTWRRVARTMLSAHAAAVERAAALAAEGPTVDQLRIGIIADEFTTTTVGATSKVIPLDRERWAEQLRSEALDLVFVESAWEGNEGSWRRGVGHYSDEESADLDALLRAARQMGIPSVFWNKEDPVHFKRFRRAASKCDHVFTTDAAVIPQYLATEGAITKTVSALPFYAQPRIHNPLPSKRAYSPTIAHAGTYYGDRYSDRSRRLRGLLDAAQPFGLTLFDRQADNPDSPYRFPEEYQKFVVGALPYTDVLDAYKSHIAHLNVNSVEDSPTMFSRRVVEIAASGGVLLSSASRGMLETFGSTIPSTNESAVWRSLLHDWSTNPVARVREAWLQMRTIHRSHTAAFAIALVARTAGIPVAVTALPTYGLVLEQVDIDALRALSLQSVLPLEVFVPADGLAIATSALEGLPIVVRKLSELDDANCEWFAERWTRGARTHFEDLLYATRFGSWDQVLWRAATPDDEGATLARVSVTARSLPGIRRRFGSGTPARADAPEDRGAVELLLSDSRGFDATQADLSAAPRRRQTVLIAGHDLKFAGGLIEALVAQGDEVLIDQWSSHTDHSTEESKALLERADVVWAEWGLGNAEWYSKHLKKRQRLVVRVHLQELQRPFLRKILHDRVDRYVFVGELIRLAAIESHGVPAEKAVVIPNFVDVDSLSRQKEAGAEFNLGFVGMVPQRKRLDLAVSLLERLVQQDERFRLFVKGKRPEEYSWMADRDEETSFYECVYRRIDKINAAHPGAVSFDAHGDDMAAWYQKIGVALSTSDYESFHFTIADGAASGAMPASLMWPGAEYIYPREWLYPDLDSMARAVFEGVAGERAESSFIRERFSQKAVVAELLEVIQTSRVEGTSR